MASSRLRRVVAAKALHVHRILAVAMDDVEQQFVGGMRQVAQLPPNPSLRCSLDPSLRHAPTLTRTQPSPAP